MDKKKTLWGIALPLMLNMMVSQLQLVIDRSFLGQIQVEYMSALGNVTAPLWTTISVIWALSTGGTIMISQALGARKEERAGDLAHASLKYTSLSGLFIFLFWFIMAEKVFRLMGVAEPVLGYCMEYITLLMPIVLLSGILAGCTSLLQSSGDTKPILISGVARSLMNVLLDWLLIFGTGDSLRWG